MIVAQVAEIKISNAFVLYSFLQVSEMNLYYIFISDKQCRNYFATRSN